MTSLFKRIDSKFIWKVLIVLAPVGIAGLVVLIQGLIQEQMSLPIPSWNDEAAYYSLVKTMLSHGQPTGYWGFNGGHAIIGTGSGWSSAIIFPYAMFAWIFGMNYHTVFFANVFYLSLAQFLFLILVKPEKEKLNRILILQLTSVVTILYMTTSMSEPFRFALAIVLAGIFHRLYFMKTSWVFRYVLIPIYIMVISQIYIFMVFCVPIYMFGILRNWKIWKRILISFLSMALVAGLSYYILHLISSNYNIYKTEDIFNALSQGDYFGAIVVFLKNVLNGVYTLLSITDRYVGNGMFVWFVPFCVLMCIVPLGIWLMHILKTKNYKKTDDILLMIVAYSMSLFLFMYVSVYSLERFTFFRGIGIVIIFSMYLLTQLENRKVYLLFGVLYGLGVVFLPLNLADFSTERYLSNAEITNWCDFSESLEEVLVLRESSDPWANTIAVYTLEPEVMTSIPSGFGVNMMMDQTIFSKDAAYLLLPVNSPEDSLRTDWLEADYQNFMKNNSEMMKEYTMIFEGNGVQIYKKQDI